MTADVDTNRYEFVHGRKPRGRGTWVFLFVGLGAGRYGKVEFAPSNLLWGEARRWAIQRARALDVPIVELRS